MSSEKFKALKVSFNNLLNYITGSNNLTQFILEVTWQNKIIPEPSIDKNIEESDIYVCFSINGLVA